MKTAAVEGGRGRMRAVEVTRAEPALWGLVGNTPLIPLPPSTALARPLPAAFLKAEWFNPGGSVKDRPALFILRDGIARGELPAKRLLDASSGNTAIAYAMLGAATGVGVTVCVPGNASEERKELNPEIALVGVQPDSPFHGLEGLKHLETALVPGIWDPRVPDRMELVSTEEAEMAVRRLAREAGLFVGWSTGAALVAAERALSFVTRAPRSPRPPGRPSSALVVVLAPDSGLRYLSETERLRGVLP